MEITMNKLKEIKKEPIVVVFSDEAVQEYNILIKRDKVMNGRPTEDVAVCRCPKCGTEFRRGNYFCKLCGQRVKFVESDVIPL